MQTKLAVTLNPKNGGNMVCVFPGFIPGEWFIGISRLVGSREDTIFERQINGVYRDECVLINTNHTTMAGALGWRNEIWTRHGNDVVRFVYRPGTITRADTKYVETFVPKDQDAQLSFSPTRTYGVVRYRQGTIGHFTRRRVTDLLAKKNSRVGAEVVVDLTGRVSQSFGLVNNSLILVFGATGEKAWVEEWSFLTGKKLGTWDVTHLGNEVVPGKHEAEGAPGRYLLMKVGAGDVRRLAIYRHDLG